MKTMHIADDPSLPEAIEPGGRDAQVERALPTAGLAPHAEYAIAGHERYVREAFLHLRPRPRASHPA
jgi:hypothetical protein